MQVWFIGRTLASQAGKVGSTPITCLLIQIIPGYGSVWLERTAGGREVAGSNPVTPIISAFYAGFSFLRGEKSGLIWSGLSNEC